MQFLIIYFSGTGNTKLISHEIKKRMEMNNHQVELLSIEEIDKLSNISLENKVLGIGFPVYKFTYPKIIEKGIDKLKQVKQEQSITKPLPFFIFCTYTRFPSNSLHDLMQKLEKINLFPISQQVFKCPSNGIASMKAAESQSYQTVMFFEEYIANKLNMFVEHVINNTNRFIQKKFKIKHYGSPLRPVQLKIVNDVEKTRYPILQIDKKLCTICGVCVKNCPEKNLRITKNEIRIIDPLDCLHCLRCMHNCPTHSISFGELTHGPLRYTSKIGKMLYTEALQGNVVAYSLNTTREKRKWRFAVVRYWLKNHRRIRRERKQVKISNDYIIK